MTEIKHKAGRFYVNGKIVKRIVGCSGGHRFVGVTACGRIFKADTPRVAEYDLARQTRAEILLYENKINDHDKSIFFAKILEHGTYRTRMDGECHWLLQEKLPVAEMTDPKTAPKITKKIVKTLERLKKKYKISDIWKPTFRYTQNVYASECMNWFVMYGEPVIYDWGLNGFYDCSIEEE